MNNKKTTKRALLSSVMAIVLCLAMLIGTTFAWFTDSASTAVNKIQAGTLDIELQYQKADGTWEDAEGKVLDFKKPSGHENESILWEPGCTYELPAIRILNKGNLALKYKLAITGIKGDAKLNEAIVWTNGTGELLSEYTGTMIPGQNGNVTESIVIKGNMKEDAGNEYQGKSIEGIAITVAATQYTYENDSINNQYDVNAPFPVVAAALVNTTGETVVKAQDNSIKLTAPAGSLSDSVKKLSVTVDEVASPSTITVEDIQADQTFEVSLKDQTGAKVEAQGEKLFTVELNVGPNREGLKLYHSGVEMTNDGATLTEAADHYIYNSVTGIITMKVNSFSPFTVVYDRTFSVKTVADLAPIDSGSYYGNNTAGIYKLENNLEVTKVLRFGKDVVIDLNGHTLTTTASYWANYSNRAPEITIKNGTVAVGNYNFFWNVSSNEVVINLEKVTIDATKASAAFRTMPSNVSHKLTINADSETVVKGTFLSADPTYSANAETPSVTNIVVNGVHATVPSYGNAMRLYAQYKNSKVNAEFNNCVFDCSNGGTPVYCGAKPAENGTVSLTMSGCTLKAKSPYGIGSYIFNYNQAGVTVKLTNCLDKNGNALAVE